MAIAEMLFLKVLNFTSLLLTNGSNFGVTSLILIELALNWPTGTDLGNDEPVEQEYIALRRSISALVSLFVAVFRSHVELLGSMVGPPCAKPQSL